MSGELSALVKRLETVTTRLEGLAAGGGAAGASSETVEKYDEVLDRKFKTYFDLSAKIGGEIDEHAKLVKAAFAAARDVIVLAAKHQTPKPDVLKERVEPLGAQVELTQAFCDKRRGHKQFNHFMTIKEGIGCVGWVRVAPKPAPYVKEMHDQALFYGNRVLKEYKGKDDTHVEWMRAFTGGILELQAYVKTYHTTGLAWNKQGTVLPAAPAAGSGPPPPPPPAIQPPTGGPPAPSSGGGGADTQRAALFTSLNKGGDVTKGLKKVTNEMKTHKNPELRASSVVKASDVKPTATSKPTFGGATAAKKKPVFELQMRKWVVEYQEDNSSLAITDTNPKQSVYMFRCNKCTIKISGKINSIILDSCKKVALVFDDAISSVEIINSQSIQVQILGKCPTVSIDKTDGCQVFLNKSTLTTEIVSAKSSEMNICVPKGDDYTEHALPEQYKSKWNGKTFVTECSDIV